MDVSFFSGDEIQLSITTNYAGHWKTWEGVREMVQNWHDGLFSGSPNIIKEELNFKKVICELCNVLVYSQAPKEATPIQEGGKPGL